MPGTSLMSICHLNSSACNAANLNSKSPPPTSFDFAYSNSRSNVSLNNPSPPSSPTPDFRRRSNSIYSNASYIKPELTAAVSDTEGIRQRHIAADTTHDEDLSFEKNASSVKDTSSERGETFSEVDETD
ncbi:hypothetical protein BASA83_006345 [Batrachochytrium salamandrivorans]|nr:hypothetical protein BASA83_006345 [Batrachochytrium salamandrivorans]